MTSPTENRLTQRLRPLLLVAGGLAFYTLFLGLRGTGSAGVELIERLRQANRALMGGGELWASPHVFVDLLAIPVAALFDNEVFGFGLVSALAVSLALPAVWRMAAAISGGIGATLATGIFLGLPIVAAAATAAGEAAIVLAMWCWLLRLATLSNYRWWTTVSLALLAGALALSFAPVIIWLPAWLIATLAARGLRGPKPDPRAKGMLGQTELPVALVLGAVSVVVIPSVFFVAIGYDVGALPGAWERYLTGALLDDWPPVLFAGEVYTTERPPLTTGLVWTVFEFPAEAVIAAVAALVLPATRNFGVFIKSPPEVEGFEFPRTFCLLTLLFVLGLPWALRTRDLGGVPLLLLAAPILAILAGSILATLVRIMLAALEDRDVALGARRAFLAGILGLFLLPALVTTALYHPFQESYYNLFAGSLEGAIESGHPANRADVLPIDVARAAADRAATRTLYVGSWRPQFEAYMAEGYIEPLDLTDNRVEWQARFHERKPASARLEDEPATRVTWGPQDVGVFVLEFRN